MRAVALWFPLALYLEACAPATLPPGWLFVTEVTGTSAAVAWTGDGDRVGCIGSSGDVVEARSRRRLGGLRIAHLEGLTPASRYHCRLASVRAHPRVRFATAPGPNEQVTFAVVGDTGDGSRLAARLARRIAAGHPDIVLHLGDLAYGDATPRDLDRRFFRPYRRVLARAPLFVTAGNHDLARTSAFDAVFGDVVHGGGPVTASYAFDYGAAHLATIPSRRFPEIAQAVRIWLPADSAESPAAPWHILFLHEPLFVPGTKWVTRGLRRILEPLVEAAGTDLILAGHAHLYARSEPACVHDPRARLVQIITGGGGANLDRAMLRPGFARLVSTTHYVRLRVTPSAIRGRAIDVDGHTIDRWRIAKDAGRTCRRDGWPPIRER